MTENIETPVLEQLKKIQHALASACRQRLAACVLPTLLSLCPLAASAQLQQLRLGTWEITASGTGLPTPLTEMTCVKQSDLAQFTRGAADGSDGCKFTKAPSIEGRTWSANQACFDGRTVRAEVTAESAERIVGLVVVAPGVPLQPTVKIELAGRWLKEACASAP